jgi:hypothetical protein
MIIDIQPKNIIDNMGFSQAHLYLLKVCFLQAWKMSVLMEAKEAFIHITMKINTYLSTMLDITTIIMRSCPNPSHAVGSPIPLLCWCGIQRN